MKKSRVFSSRIPHLSEKHTFSLRKSPIYAKITRFLFENPPFKRKSRIFSSEIPHLSENHVFSSSIPHLSENHAFSLRETPFNPKTTHFLFRNTTFKRKSSFLFANPPFNPKISHFLFENPPFKQKSRVFSSQIPHLSENHAFSHRESPI